VYTTNHRHRFRSDVTYVAEIVPLQGCIPTWQTSLSGLTGYNKATLRTSTNRVECD